MTERNESPAAVGGTPQTFGSPTSESSFTFGARTPTPSESSRFQAQDIDYLHTQLNRERERRGKAEEDLAKVCLELEKTKSRLILAEKELAELRGTHWSSHMYKAYEEMGPGGALVATVAAPVMAAPLAVTTVVKGFASVGSGIGSLFSGRGDAAGTQPEAEQGKKK